MRVLVVGLGVQGRKRCTVAGSDVVATADPLSKDADYKSVYDVPIESFDAALCCIPDKPKYELVSYLLANGKHVLVEKPLWVEDHCQILHLEELARKHGVQCYTAYNHRFEPHFKAMKELIDESELGEIYRCRLFYGNGTARIVRDSEWRDQGAGVLPDLASHLLDTVLFWFGEPSSNFEVVSASRFENKSLDHVILSCERSTPKIELEMTLLQWKNDFRCDVLGSKGSAHIESLCKWGPTAFIVRDRVFPVGKPGEKITTLVQADPTWRSEYEAFIELCHSRTSANLSKDLWLASHTNRLSKDAVAFQ